MWYSRIKRFFDDNLWTISMVADGVAANKINEDEFKQIVGKDYKIAIEEIQK